MISTAYLILVLVVDRALTGVCAFIPSPPKNVLGDRKLYQTLNSPSAEATIDPFLVNAISKHGVELSSYVLRDLTDVSNGIRTWKSALAKGRLPLPSEFLSGQPWPDEPLFSNIVDVMTLLQLPRFAQRHPETVYTIILSMIRLNIQFMEELHQAEQSEKRDLGRQGQHIDGDEVDSWATDEIGLEADLSVEAIAGECSEAFVEEWSSVVGGVGILDQLFGFDHNFLRADENDATTGAEVTVGFGLRDGIWEHSGWKFIPQYQAQLSSMPELRKLVRNLGRRPTAEKRERMHKFQARKRHVDGGLGAEKDPQNLESISGITLSSSFVEMLPSEAVLLRSSYPSLRRLFLRNKVESKLLSYELSGWTDVPSIPIMRPLRMERMPCAPGGPIIVCLDTSWSMSSTRENLSKATVLACVSAAHTQKRDCHVIAFSTERNVIEASSITANEDGIHRLLEFLSNSFGGGTDVTGALKFAMDALDSDMMSAADILLVTDGEIPDPPVSNSMMEALDSLKHRKGVEIHGLLVGKKESKPLSRLCTEVHDFLSGYENNFLRGGRTSTSLGCFASNHAVGWHREAGPPRFVRSRPALRERAFSFALRARSANDDDNHEWPGRPKKKKVRRNKVPSETDYDGNYAADEYEEDGSMVSPYLENVENSLRLLKESAEVVLSKDIWKPDLLEKEREAPGSCWRYRNELRSAIDRVDDGLVERTEEARLVVLAMLATEHVLLLGVPGTGKSVIGRRLSNLCNGRFFQRLLTRFTTPEELFGPLSLRSLENDEYRRVTAGYLPSASVAFLDEIFKANSSILNTLLTILNERRFDNAGGQEDCPIRCVVGASNELPDSDELVALYDRFLIRKEVQPVSDEGLVEMLSMPNPGYSICNSSGNNCDMIFTNGLDHIVAGLSAAADSVSMSLHACELVRDLRTFMREDLNVDISDRRLVKSSRLLKISAASHGRNRVDPIDCMLLQHCVWQMPEQRAAIKEWLWDNITPGSKNGAGSIRFLLDGLRQEISELVRSSNGDVTGSGGGRDSDISALKGLARETTRLVEILHRQKADLARHAELIQQSNEYLWLDPDEAQAMKQMLLPRIGEIADEVGVTLSDAVALQLSIEGSDFLSDDCRLSVIDSLWKARDTDLVSFTEKELQMSMKEAKANYDADTFRKWKRARKKTQN